MALTLDGSNKNSAGGTQTGGSVSLTTTGTDDIIVVVVFNENSGQPTLRTISSISDTASLTWNNRVQITSTDNGGDATSTEVWWAHAPSALTGDSISFTFSGTTDDWSAIAFGVNGANVSSPWDPNVSLPEDATRSGGFSSASTGTWSTTKANTMLLTFLSSASDPGASPQESGYTLIQSGGTSAGRAAAYTAAQYQVVSSAQSSQTSSFTPALGDWVIIADAIQAASTEVDIPGSTSSLGFTQAASVDLVLQSTSESLGFTQASTVSLQFQPVAQTLGVTMTASLEDAKLISAAMELGFTQANTVEFDSDITAAMTLGFAQTTSQFEIDLVASQTLGFAQAATVNQIFNPTVNMTLGFTAAASLDLAQNVPAAMELGVSMAVQFSGIDLGTVAMAVGMTQSSPLGTILQPVVNASMGFGMTALFLIAQKRRTTTLAGI